MSKTKRFGMPNLFIRYVKNTTMKKLNQGVFLLFILAITFVSCEKTLPGAPDENELLDRLMEGLTNTERLQFFRGDEAFGETFTAETGLGFLDAVTDAFLIALSDPNDTNGNGISGHPHYTNIPSYVDVRINAIPSNGKYITRFGKKGAAYNLLHQTSGAYNQDMGITSIFEPIDPATQLEVDPEVSTQTVNDVVAYLKTLKAPIQRNTNDPAAVVAGQQLFTQIECSGCHTPTMETGFSPISALSYKTFSPYTDLLLHDMGPGLDDNYTEGHALTSEWKTLALWGLGLSFEAQGGMVFLLHDGRATTIDQAITFYGGEATGSKNKYDQLSETEKQQLITFLKSL